MLESQKKLLCFWLGMQSCLLVSQNNRVQAPPAAENLGVFGETFVIEEPDLIEYIMSRLIKLKESGEMESLNLKAQQKVKCSLERPTPVSGVTHTTKYREFVFDPTIRLKNDLIDHRGVVFARKGETFNPLAMSEIKMRPFLFIDGDEQSHIDWALSQLKNYEQGKIILVNGAPLELQKKLNRDIYFDQHGLLTQKFGIKHVPAMVFQKKNEKVLTVVECLPQISEEK